MTATKKLEGESLTLANEIGPAYAAVTEAEGQRETASGIVIEKQKLLAPLLIRAHELHKGIEKFKAFLEQCPGAPAATRAYEIMKIAKGGPAVAEKLKTENARRQKEHRDRLKAEREEQAKKPAPPPPPPAPTSNVIPLRNEKVAPTPSNDDPLVSFKSACDAYLHLLDEEDLLAAANYAAKIVRTISTPESRLTKEKKATK